MVASQIKEFIQIQWDPNVPGHPSDMPLYIERRDLLEVYMGTKMFNITVVQLWLM